MLAHCMSTNAFNLMLASIAFTSIAMLTWFFSTRRKLFIRVFVPPDDFRNAVRSLPRKGDYTRSFRLIGALQFLLAGCFWIAFLFAWLW